MSLLFPKHKKCALPEVSSPAAYLAFLRCHLNLPAKAVFCPLPALTKYVQNHTQHEKYSCGADIYVLKKHGVCYVTNFGVGAPALAAELEKVLALGVKEAVFIGLAGSLQEEVQPADIVLCSEALADDGTSPCYVPGETVRPNRRLLESLARGLRAGGTDFHIGRNWTTDALFRETKSEIRHYQKHAVLTVEMETAAFYAVCRKRGARAAAGLVVSDCLNKLRWEPHFTDRKIPAALETLFKTAIKTLQNFPARNDTK